MRLSRRTPERPAPGSRPALEPWRHGASDRTVAVLVYRGASSSDIELVADALAAGLDASVHLVAADPGEVIAVEPVRSVVCASLDSLTEPTALVLPGGLGWQSIADDAAVVDWIRTAALAAQGLVAVSTGSLLLAATGLLDGVEATGHWLGHRHLERLGAEAYRERIVAAGDGRWITASGARAGAEAAADLGPRILYGPS